MKKKPLNKLPHHKLLAVAEKHEEELVKLLELKTMVMHWFVHQSCADNLKEEMQQLVKEIHGENK